MGRLQDYMIGKDENNGKSPLDLALSARSRS